MQKEQILALLAKHRADLDRYGVRSLALFGSVVRGEEKPESDIDMLVEFDGPATFDGYMELKFYLEDLLGQSVDLVTSKALRPQLRP
ncbi:MAG: nucleotidyltransferase family protein [Rhodothermales bacterium]